MLSLSTELLSVANRLLYIDPAATSVLLASLTSIAVVAGAVFIILWRKLKKGVKKTLHIDENAGKEVEDELVVTDEELEGAETVKAEETEAAATEESAAAEEAEEKTEEEEPAAVSETEEKAEAEENAEE